MWPISSKPSFAYSSFGQSSRSAIRKVKSWPASREASSARVTVARARPRFEGKHVLDLADVRFVIELAVAPDLAVGATREEACIDRCGHHPTVLDELPHDVLVLDPWLVLPAV